MRFKKFLLDIKPTKKGTRALCICLFIIPLIADLFLVFAGARLYDQGLSVTMPLLNAHIRLSPVLVMYLFLYYIISILWEQWK